MESNFSNSTVDSVFILSPEESHHFAEYGVFFIGLIGVTSNAFVLYCFLGNRILRRRLRNMLIIHQSLVDLGASALFLLSYTSKSIPKTFHGVSGDVLCALLDGEAPMWIFLCVSTANLVLITFERFFIVVRPVFYQTRITRCWVLTAILATWFTTASLQGILFFYTSGVRRGQCYVVGLWPSKPLEKSFCVYYLVVNFFVPVGVFIACYGHMLAVTRRRQRVLVNCHMSLDEADIKVQYRRTLRLTTTQTNLTKTMVIVSVCFAVCWAPSHIHYFLTTFEVFPELRFHGRMYRIVTYIALSNVCVNPFVYGFKYEDFRREAKKVKRSNRNPQESHTATSSS
jgi:hypothetical protein